MDTKKKSKVFSIINYISTIVSWTVFVLLIICAILLFYYFISIKIYAKKGSGYEPKFSLYTIITPSMVPNINVYDVIVDVKVDSPEDIKLNDVITYQSSVPGVIGGTITHRVIAINKDEEGNYYYLTKGDNNLVDDGVKVSYNSIVGKVALRIPGLGKIQRFLVTKTGWIVCILIPCLFIIIKAIFRVLRENNPRIDNFFKRRKLLTFKRRELLPYKASINMPTYLRNNEDNDLPSLK